MDVEPGTPLQAAPVAPETVEAVWVRYWAPLLKDGGLDRLKGELYDAWFLVNEARKVYRHATGGLCDDLCASAEGIIAMDEARVGRLVEALQARISHLEAVIAGLGASPPPHSPVDPVPGKLREVLDRGPGWVEGQPHSGSVGHPDPSPIGPEPGPEPGG